MRILVTGGTGNVGRTAVARLVRNGHQVRVIGRRAEVNVEGAEYRVCDTTDFESLREQVRGMEGIVHLAAIPWPGGGAGQEIFDVNCRGTFNVFQAAADKGIAKISCASSINALGYNYGVTSFPLQYFPIDEEHPTCTTDAYSFSKQVTEAIADYFWRRDGISSVNLRLPGVYEVRAERLGWIKQRRARFREAFHELMALPGTERQKRVRRAIDRFDAGRRERWTPMSHEEMRARWRALRNDPDMLLLGGRTDFWASIHAEDAAQALEQGLLAEYRGSHPLFVNDSHNSTGISSETLARVFFPDVTERTHPLIGTESLVSIDKARRLIGFEPEYSTSKLFASMDE
jgi:nucleoside-diphosphate-sugar epimerase